ncbi:nucleotidyltransferase domain-containing protein [Thermodesulfovibrio sp. Kuro-1]|uniref:nucleotidyltransferase domain-containing protein n=1 Tax=Thermodesulfovibrio sp. Kuro-1 TaxID=2580394 RepID=UPI0011412667|nr:nucleotidyltransferase domain-containing protein [Thermodesulfovibrio sp. Kuro-1]
MKKIRGYKKKYMKIIEQLKNLCLNYYKDRLIAVVVFGSVAKGMFSPVSDVDLLIILKNRKSQYREYSDYYDNVESKISVGDLMVEINPIFKSIRELSIRIPYLWNTEFLILYDKENFFRDFLKKLQEFKEKFLVFHTNPFDYIKVLNDKQGTF